MGFREQDTYTLARYVNVKACRNKLGLLGEDHSKGFSVSLLKEHLFKIFPSLLRRNAKARGSGIQGHRCFYYYSRSRKYIPVLLDLGSLIKTGRSGVYDHCGSHNTMTQAIMLIESRIRWLCFESELVILTESCTCFADKVEIFLMGKMPGGRRISR